MNGEDGSGAEPKLDPSVWIAPSAQLYGAWAGAEYEAWLAAKRAEIEADRDL